ncbi:MAG TPA: 50S ribosomal protein L29 [Candidatus Saccharibacteria bacterium]|nr:50S ribosomal protein L29 [Candidatus Saccharibacteria bacterium]
MKASELRAKSVDELQTLLVETRTSLLENKRALAAGELPNPRVVGKTRREIARIQTLISEKKVTETSKGEA